MIAFSWLTPRLKSPDGDVVASVLFTRVGTQGGRTAQRTVMWVVPADDQKPRESYIPAELDAMAARVLEINDLDAEITDALETSPP